MIDLILKLGGLQALVLSLLLFMKRKSSKAKYVLAVLLLLLGLICFFYSLNKLDFYISYPHFIRINWGLPLLIGPLILLYTYYFSDTQFKVSKEHVWWFLPYIINIIILLPFFIKSGEEKIQILDYFTASISRGTDNYKVYDILLIYFTSIIGIYFCSQSLKPINKLGKVLMNEFSETEKVKLIWLKVIIYSFIIVFSVFALSTFIAVSDQYPAFDYELYFYLVLFVLIYILTYKTLNYSHLFGPQKVIKAKGENIVKAKKTKNSNSPVLTKKLLEFVEEEMPYLNGELTASDLANSLEVSRHQLSEILNNNIGKSFYLFINEYRVKTFKEKLNDPRNNHLTLLGIAYDSGFNSKTSFNTIFKKITGTTPTQYKKSLIN